MATRRHSTDGNRLDAWVKQLSTKSTSDARTRTGPLVLVVGGGWFGRGLADGLAATHRVHHLDTDPDVVADASPHEASLAPNLAAFTALEATGIADDDVAIVATGRDARSLLVTQNLRTQFGLERILVVLEDPRNHDAFDVPGVAVVCAGRVLSEAVRSVVDEGEGSPVNAPTSD